MIKILPVFIVVIVAGILTLLFWLYINSSINEVKTKKRDIELIDKLISGKNIKTIKKKKVIKIIKNILFYGMLIIIVPFLVYSAIVRIKGSDPKIGNTIIMVVGSGSMSFKNEANVSYLSTIDDERQNYQFNKGDIIFVREISQDSELKLYDVVCYYDKEKNENIIHRIIEIKDNEKIEYITRGDANNGDDNAHTIDDMIGIYRGKHIAAVGNIVLFLQNPIGIATIFTLLYLLVIIDYFLKKLSKAENTKMKKFEKLIGFNNLTISYIVDEEEVSFDSIFIYYLDKCYEFNKDGFVKKYDIGLGDEELKYKSKELFIKRINVITNDGIEEINEEYKINK